MSPFEKLMWILIAVQALAAAGQFFQLVAFIYFERKFFAQPNDPFQMLGMNSLHTNEKPNYELS